MKILTGKYRISVVGLAFAAIFLVLPAASAMAEGYGNALEGVEQYDVVYDVSQSNPKIANVVFWAVKDSYKVDEVKRLNDKPKVAVVFHGPAVKLISSDRSPFNSSEWAEVEKFQQTLREMKKDGVTLEVCLYAARVVGVDKDTIIPEVDQVGNGFVSVIGYQQQGYAVVRIP